ncbi:MAG: transglutaminase domain-containing protein [Bacteroidota bacterium]|nr:transglutaminase domain-containing protein [Bacteroidota bacterium]MDP4194979.1 transglutaminase domain-containing protein [Bacteroidota bacterium]
MKFSYNLFTLFSLIFLSYFSCLTAQDRPIKWGDIPRSDLEMTSFPQDSNASAVILCDYGESNYDDNLELIYQRHRRIKILTKKGYELGTHSVVVNMKDGDESIYGIEGTTYWLNEQGKVESRELDEKDVFKEKIDNERTLCRFTLPALTPGCVIEFRYKIRTNHIEWMRSWVFQESEPVRWSEYRICFPKSFGYSCVAQGYEPFVIKETKTVRRDFSGTARSFLGGESIHCNLLRWAVENLPAIREEPFITTTSDYVNEVDIQLIGYAIPGIGERSMLTDWKTATKDLLRSEYFGGKIEVTSKVKKLAEELTSAISSPEEKIKAIYNWISSTIVWSGRNRFEAEKDADDILESKTGSSAEINFLLLSLLKSAGISGDPVLLSTRDHGKVQDVYPILSQFNYMLARVTLGDKTYFLDATDPLRPMDLLPEKVLNVRGYVVKEEGAGWVNIKTDINNKKNSLVRIKLQDDGSFNGEFEESYSGYAARSLRNKLKSSKPQDVAKEAFLSDETDISIDSVSVTEQNSIEKDLTIAGQISSSNYAQSTGEMIYINPSFINRHKENPFKLQSRKYPVDFSYKSASRSYVTITIPEGFEIKDGPKTKTISTALNNLIYTRQVQIEANQITLLTKMETKETIFAPHYYEQLKEFYSYVVAAESEQFVLSKKKSDVSSPAILPAKEAQSSQSAKPESGIKTGKSKNEKRKL